MSVDIGTISGKVAFDLDTSALTEAVTKLGDIGAALTRTGENSKSSGDVVEAAYRKIAASLDPAVAAQQKYEASVRALGAAVDKGLISLERYDELVAVAKGNYSAAAGAADQYAAKVNAARQATADASQQKLASDLNAATEAYRKLAGSLDPVTASTNRYQDARKTLDAALAKGIITEAQHIASLEAAGKKYLEAGDHVSRFSQLLGGLDSVSSAAGGLTEEIAAKFSAASETVSGLGESLAALGPLVPIVGALAVAALGIGVAFEAVKFTAEFLVDVTKEGLKTQVIVDQLNNSLHATGAAAGYSAAELLEHAEKLALATGRSKDFVAQGELTLSRFTKLGHEALPAATQAALDYAQATGKGEEAFVKIGSALEGNAKSLTSLKDIGLVFTAGQKASLAEMVKTGDIAGYQAILFQALKEQVGGAAEAFGGSLSGELARSRTEFSLFKETIASEMLPAFKLLVDDIVRSVGGWENLHNIIQIFAHEVGDFIRTMVESIIADYHKWNYESDLSWANLVEGVKHYEEAFFAAITAVVEAYSKLPAALGGGTDVWAAPIAALKRWKSENSASLQAVADDARKSGYEQAAAYAQAEIALGKHTLALQGNTNVEKQHGSVLDTIPEKQKSVASAMDAVARALQIYSEKLADVTAKELASKTTQDALLASLGRGIIAYDLEKAAQAEAAAGNAAIKTLYDAQRTAVDKLSESKAKLIEAGRSSDAAQVQKDIDGLNAAYLVQSYIVGVLAAETAADKAAETSKLSALKDSLAATDAYRIAIAAFTDAVTGNLDASRAASAQIEIEKEFRDQLTPAIHANADAEAALYEKITRTVTAERERVNLLKDETAEQGKLTALFNQADYQTLVSKIDTTTSAAVQQLETSYLTLLTDSGKRTVAKGEELWTELARVAGVSLTAYEKGILSALQDIQDAATVKKFAGGGNSIYDQYAAERADIERLMAASADRVHLTVKDGLKALEDLQNKYIDGQLSAYSSAFGILSQEFGGVFTKILRFIQILQEIQTLREDVSTIVSGLGGLGGVFGTAATATTTNTTALASNTAALAANTAALGADSASGAGNVPAGGGGISAGTAGGLAVVAAFVAAYFIGSQILSIRDRHSFGSPGAYSVQNGQGIETGETQIADAIKAFIKNFETLAGVTVESLDQIGIKVQNSGKEFRAYVGDTLIGTFGSLEEAVGTALQRAFSTAKFSGTIDPAIAELVKSNGSTDFTTLAANIKTVTDAIHQNLPQMVVDFRKFGTDFDDEVTSQLSLFNTHASAGFKELFSLDLQKWSAGVNSLRDSITGQQQSAFITFEQQRKAFNAENDARKLSIQAQIEETKTKLLAAGVTIATINQILGVVSDFKNKVAADSVGGLNGGFGTGAFGGGLGPGVEGYDPTGRGPGQPGSPGNVAPTPAGGPGGTFAQQQADDLKAVLAQLVAELTALPADIKSSEFNGNTNSSQYFSNQLAGTDKDFLSLIADLVKSGESAKDFGSDLSNDLANLTLTLEDQRRAITGETLSAKQELEIKKQQAAAWNAQLVLDEAALQLQILKQQADIDAAIASRALAQATIDNAKAMGDAAAILAAVTAAAAGVTDAQLAAMQQNLAALQGVLDALKNEKPIDPNTIKVQGGSGSGSGGQTPAQQLAAFFKAFDHSQLSAVGQQLDDIKTKYDDEIKLVGKNKDAIAKLNAEREVEIAKVLETARATAIGNVNSFLAVNGPQLTAQIVGVNNSAQSLIDGLRELNKEGGLSTQQLHALVPAIRAAAAAQVEAIKQSVFASIDAFAGVLQNTGLTSALAGIDTQAKGLRDSLNELAAAGVLTADQFNKSAQEIVDAANAQKQAVIANAANSLLGELYGYLKDDKDAAALKYTLTIAELEVQRNQLALAGYSAAALAVIDGLINRVVAAGPSQFDTNPAATGPNPANALADAAAQQANAASTLQSAADALQSAVQTLSDYGKSLLTNSTLSALTPSQQLAAAKSQLQADYSLAKTGDVTAITNYQGLANTFLQLAHSQDPSNSIYGVDFRLVLDEINSITSANGTSPLGVPGGPGTSGLPTFQGAFPTDTSGTPDTPGSAASAKTLHDLASSAADQAQSTAQLLSTADQQAKSTSTLVDLTKATTDTITSLYTRNHDDLSALQDQVVMLAGVVKTQQSSLDRIVSHLDHP